MKVLDEDINLIEGCKLGNKQAQRMVYKLYSQDMFSLSIQLSEDLTEAEQIMIKAFSKAFSDIDKYNGLGSFEAWIKSLVLNEANNMQQKNLERMIFLGCEHPDKNQSYRKNQRTIFSKPGIIPQEYKKALNRFVLEGYSTKEIALLMGITLNSSRTNIQRTRTILKAKISKLASRISYPTLSV